MIVFARGLSLSVGIKVGALAFVAAIIIFLLSISIYRLFFHPYARYPGPFLAKLTSWYSVYHTYIGDLHTDVYECHCKYGDIIRYGPNRIVINTVPAWKAIYGHGSNVAKSKAYLRMSLVPGAHNTIGTLDDHKHGKKRRILKQGLSDAQIRTMDFELRSAALNFAEQLGEEHDRFAHAGKNDGAAAQPSYHDGWSGPKNMAHWCDFFAFDVMSHIVFGMSYNLLRSAENHWIVECVMGQMRRFSFLMQLPELEDMGLHRFLFPEARRKALRFVQKSREIMEARRTRSEKDGSATSDVFTKLLAARDAQTGYGLDQRQLWAESNLLIVAGSDTSSAGLAATFFYLSANPQAYDRAAAEVRSVFPTPEAVAQGPKLSSCTYLRACVQEALRMSPPAGGPMWREALAGGLRLPRPGGPLEAGRGTWLTRWWKQKQELADLFVPAGLEVASGIYALNHNAAHFPDPMVYRPERWLSAEGDEDQVARAKAAFATFSTGPRNCVGQGLAVAEIMMAIAAVMAGYDFRRATDRRLAAVGESQGSVFAGQYLTKWSFTSIKDGPYLEFKRTLRTTG
ncbi:uncharacterized protein PgNI_11563 [Pyricularia grisea]|uniref:Uncharacterized protein n=1 Tax=Pyricularia grisea TaxID=148305 RepID=A0A6P8AN85_PYRGI|nr:uncharacterized protein PgNI_11563 [Pyricularia grisea]TLD03502.1 hypothetical protein PgNI_11563 [Pyricularia grisea]